MKREKFTVSQEISKRTVTLSCKYNEVKPLVAFDREKNSNHLVKYK